MNDVIRTERGWCGHFICGDRCRFRRNTLLECGDKKFVISTVGVCIIDNEVETIGLDRWYETMAFIGEDNGGYIDADVTKQIDFESEWGIWGTSWEEVLAIYTNPDNAANDMHEKVVDELTKKIQSQEEMT